MMVKDKDITISRALKLYVKCFDLELESKASLEEIGNRIMAIEATYTELTKDIKSKEVLHAGIDSAIHVRKTLGKIPNMDVRYLYCLNQYIVVLSSILVAHAPERSIASMKH